MLKKHIKNLFWNVKGGYRPKEFWEKWSKTFMDDPWQRKILPQHKWMLEIVKKKKPESILEVGCGFGRNIKFLIENGVSPDSILGVDISGEMIKKARSYIKNDRVKLKVADCLSFPFLNKSFDLVLVHAVFMHIKPSEITKAIKEVKRIGKSQVIVIEQNYLPQEGDPSRKYTFVHDYKNLFKKQKLKIRKFVESGKYGYYYFLLEPDIIFH